MKNTLKKLTCGVLAAVSVFGCAMSLTACETSNPEVKMELSFNGESYTLKYKLYRKAAPDTVEHFLYLADNGYYDGLCVHNYMDDTAMYAGGYTATEGKATELVYKKYYQTIAGYDNYEKFPNTIWLDADKKSPVYTLLGEFKDNNFEVESGAIKQSFGSLAMYYFDIQNTDIADTNVYTPYKKSSKKGEMRTVDYKYNCTTSMFSITLNQAEQENTKYCTFATLKNDGELEDLLAAIEEYAGEESFTENTEMKIFEDDALLKDMNTKATFAIPKSAIVINKVKVTKY